MKKYLIFFLVIICGTILFSCTDNMIDSEDDLNPGDEIIIPDEISPTFDYEGLGFKLKFVNQNATPLWQRTDGEIDPLRNASFISEPQKNLSDKAIVLKDIFFHSDDYSFYGPNDDSFNFYYYPDISSVNNNLKILFYNDGIEPYVTRSMIPYTLIDGIVSNHETSYVINTQYKSNRDFPIQFNYHFLFTALYYDDTLPYRVYFNEDYIFLMSKEEGFSKKYLEKFTPEYGVFLFKD